MARVDMKWGGVYGSVSKTGCETGAVGNREKLARNDWGARSAVWDDARGETTGSQSPDTTSTLHFCFLRNFYDPFNWEKNERWGIKSFYFFCFLGILVSLFSTFLAAILGKKQSRVYFRSVSFTNRGFICDEGVWVLICDVGANFYLKEISVFLS